MSNVIESLSWRMATEICRRDPAITIRQTHPDGGQYDCLSLMHPDIGHLADLNRQGSIHIFNRLDDRPIPEHTRQLAWEQCLTATTRSLADNLSERLGQTVPTKLPPSSPRVLIYRLIASMLATRTFEMQRWECRNGYLDTSGHGGGVARWFEKFPSAAARLVRSSEQQLWDTAVMFWFVLRDQEPVVCLHEDGTAWKRHCESISGWALYAERRKLWPIAQNLLGDWLE